MTKKVDIEEFKNAVFQIVQLIPVGRATNYGAIAKAIGYPNMSRLVGHVLADSDGNNVPAHRVVNSQGSLSGRESFPSPSTMQNLLESEGIKVKNNKICSWKTIFWNPIEELRP